MEETTAVAPPNNKQKQEEINPENQLANLRNILFGHTAKTIDERLEKAEATLIEHRAELNKQYKQLDKHNDAFTKSIAKNVDTLNETIGDLRQELAKVREEQADQIAQLTKMFEERLEALNHSQKQFEQKVVDERTQLSDLLIQLGTQINPNR